MRCLKLEFETFLVAVGVSRSQVQARCSSSVYLGIALCTAYRGVLGHKADGDYSIFIVHSIKNWLDYRLYSRAISHVSVLVQLPLSDKICLETEKLISCTYMPFTCCWLKQFH